MNTETHYVISESLFFVRDEPKKIKTDGDIQENLANGKYKVLEQYYNDIYKLFLAKLAKFDIEPTSSEVEQKKLRSLLDEIMYVKAMIWEEK